MTTAGFPRVGYPVRGTYNKKSILFCDKITSTRNMSLNGVYFTCQCFAANDSRNGVISVVATTINIMSA